MCGIAGLVYFDNSPRKCAASEVVKRMSGRMQSRGPDAEGLFLSRDGNACFGHRRLSILDLDERSDQPMSSEDGRYTLVYNGEIYNYEEIRKSLEAQGLYFSTSSDTEVILKLFQLEETKMFSRLRGMFSLAIWDETQKKLFLARDPYGIKPLYLAKFENGLVFASQVKSILSSGLVSERKDSAGVASFWLFGSVIEPNTWFKDVKPISPGTWYSFDENGCECPSNSFFDINELWRTEKYSDLTSTEISDLVQSSVTDSVRSHLISDVPVGIFLSGGIDSGALAGIASEASKEKILGITISFDEFRGTREDEVPDAARIANQYGLEHRIRRFCRDEFEESLQEIFYSMDQPSIDGINTWFASKAASEHGLKVILSGIGGDELFAGYNSFKEIPKLVDYTNIIKCVPGGISLLSVFGQLMYRRTANYKWKSFSKYSDNYFGAYWLKRGLFDLEEVRGHLGRLSVKFDREVNIEALIKNLVGELSKDSCSAIGQLETNLYLRNQLLRDADWASMAHSVELRTPFVDSFLLKKLTPCLPYFTKLDGKRILANCPRRPLAAQIVNKRKTGFNVPLGAWQGKQKNMHLEKDNLARQTSVGSRLWSETVASSTY